MRLAASSVCLQWKMLRMIVDKTGRSAIVARRVTVVVSPRPELVAWGYAGFWRRPAVFWSDEETAAGPRKRRVALRYIV